MLPLLRHVFQASFLFALEAAPTGYWPPGYLRWGVIMGAEVLLALLWARRRRLEGLGQGIPVLAGGAAMLALVLMMARPLIAGPLSARIWHLSASVVAVLAPLCGIPRRSSTGQRLGISRALACRLDANDPSLAPWQMLLLGGVHAAGIALLFQREAIPRTGVVGLAVVALGIGAWVEARTGGRVRPRPEILSGLLLPYGSTLLRWGVGDSLGADLAVYQDFAYADLWTPLVDLELWLIVGAALTLASAIAPAWRSVQLRARVPLWLPSLLLAFPILLAGMVATAQLSRGASGSDPFCYLQMAADLAERATPRHAYALAETAWAQGLPAWPVVPVGYHPPTPDGLAATVWPAGWPALLAVPYALGGEGLALWAAPLCLLAATLLTARVAWVMHPEAPRHYRMLGAIGAGSVLITSPEALRWSLVPMADAAAAALSVLVLWGWQRARRQDSLWATALAGAALAAAYSVRHPQLLLVLGLPWVYGGRAFSRRRSLKHLVLFVAAALVVALPDIWYRTKVFGAPWSAVSDEWMLLAPRHIAGSLRLLWEEALLARAELGYLLPLLLLGVVAQLRAASERWRAGMLWGSLLGVLALSLSYQALRLRDLIALLPWAAIWVGGGVVALLGWAGRARRLGRLAAVTVALMALLVMRGQGVLMLREGTGAHAFGHVSRVQREAFDLLGRHLPEGAAIGASLNSGALERYTGRAAFRPAWWDDAEFARWAAALEAEGRSLYLLDDGEEMERVMERARELGDLTLAGEFDLPTFGLGGEALRRPAILYHFERDQ